MSFAAFWFRRDLRIEDNTGLFNALSENKTVLPLFIFDEEIIDELDQDDSRISFIHQQLEKLDSKFKNKHSSLLCIKGNPHKVWETLIDEYPIESVYTNRDYEPYALERDEKIATLLKSKNVNFKTFKDQVIFEKDEVVKDDGNPYTVFTPFKNKWLKKYVRPDLLPDPNFSNLIRKAFDLPTLEEIGFKKSSITVLDFDLSVADNYDKTRDYPATNGTSNLSPHLRFGTVSIRQIIHQLKRKHETFVSELVWREFFMQILFHFPRVVNENFKEKYNKVPWRNNEQEFELWCQGKTGYPLVDAGMRELNATGYMHNRVRMITAGFLCKHLLIDWRWGEAYFAKKLLDFELSSNNGNWQWAAGTGCDAAPYFRVFNPATQIKKFDSEYTYIKKWVPEVDHESYCDPIVDHKFARERAIETYKKALNA